MAPFHQSQDQENKMAALPPVSKIHPFIRPTTSSSALFVCLTAFLSYLQQLLLLVFTLLIELHFWKLTDQ